MQTPASRLERWEPRWHDLCRPTQILTMTVQATPARRRPVSHAFVVPVVRELAPELPHTAAASATW
jgi:hypothetical protein